MAGSLPLVVIVVVMSSTIVPSLTASLPSSSTVGNLFEEWYGLEECPGRKNMKECVLPAQLT